MTGDFENWGGKKEVKNFQAGLLIFCGFLLSFKYDYLMHLIILLPLPSIPYCPQFSLFSVPGPLLKLYIQLFDKQD